MEFQQLIQQRRSIRAYQAGRTIEPAVIEDILRDTQQAPTWKNSQTGRYYIVLSDKKRAEILETCLPPFNQKSSANANALIVTTFVKNVSGHSNGEPDNEIGNEWGAYDLGLANAYLTLSASEHGLDTLIMGIRDGEMLREKLSIPAEEEVVAVIALGYREKDVSPRQHKPLEEIAKFY